MPLVYIPHVRANRLLSLPLFGQTVSILEEYNARMVEIGDTIIRAVHDPLVAKNTSGKIRLVEMVDEKGPQDGERSLSGGALRPWLATGGARYRATSFEHLFLVLTTKAKTLAKSWQQHQRPMFSVCGCTGTRTMQLIVNGLPDF